MWFLASALAAAPLDGDGEFVHVATLPIHTMHAPNLLQRSLQLLATAPDLEDRGLYFTHGFGEIVHITPDGHLEREAFRHVQTNTMGMFGHFAVADGGVTYYEMPHGVRRADLTTGKVEATLAPVTKPEMSYLVRTPKGGFWLASTQTKTMRRHGKNRWEEPVPWVGLRRDGFPSGERALPCGHLDDGTPLVTWLDFEKRTAHLGTLDEELQLAKTLWTLPIEYDTWSGRNYDGADSCSFVGGLTHIGLMGQIFVYRGDTLVSAIRAGAGPKEGFPEYGQTGPYAFQALLRSRLLGDGELLVALDRKAVDLKIYAQRVANPGSLRNSKRPIDRLRAGASGEDRYQALWDLGWWELLEQEARENGADAWRLRARSRQVVFWALSGPVGVTYMGPNRMEQLDETFLAELDGDLKKQPNAAWALYARALLLDRLGRRTESGRALAALEAELPAPGLTLADVPQLFDLAADRGDTKRMTSMLAGVDPKRDPNTHGLWSARVARAAGDLDRALQILETVETLDARRLQATVLMETGALDKSIALWTKARTEQQQLGGVEDPVIVGGLGLAYLRRGLTELSIEALSKAVELDPDTPAYKSNLAAAYTALDKSQDAMKQLYGALADAPEDPVLQHQLQTAMSKPGAGGGEGGTMVLPFDVAGGSQARVGFGDMLASMTTTQLVNAGTTVVERSKLDAVLTEQELHATARFDAATAVNIGKLTGAQSLITGNVAEFAEQAVIDLRRVDVQSGKVLASAHVDAPMTLEGLQSALEKALAKVR